MSDFYKNQQSQSSGPEPNAYEEFNRSDYQQQQQQPMGENASYYNEGPEGERGLGSTVVGGAAGGYAGHKLHGGKLATAGGAVLGAVGANMVTHAMKPKPSPEPTPAPNYGPGYAPEYAHNAYAPAPGYGPGYNSGYAYGPAPGTTTTTTTTTTNYADQGGLGGLGRGRGGGLLGGGLLGGGPLGLLQARRDAVNERRHHHGLFR